MDIYDMLVAQALSGSGGGGGGGNSSNTFSGEFIAEDTTGNQEQILEIPYEGTGFPMSICFTIEDVPTASEENKYTIIAFTGTSAFPNNRPTYNAGYYDKMGVSACAVNNSGAYQTNSETNNQIYRKNIAGRTAPTALIAITSATTIKLAVESSTTSGFYGFRTGKKYRYRVFYSV